MQYLLLLSYGRSWHSLPLPVHCRFRWWTILAFMCL